MVIVSEKASRLHNGLKLILKKHFYSIEFVSTICLMQNEGFFFVERKKPEVKTTKSKAVRSRLKKLSFIYIFSRFENRTSETNMWSFFMINNILYIYIKFS